jgi:hypothetical protein
MNPMGMLWTLTSICHGFFASSPKLGRTSLHNLVHRTVNSQFLSDHENGLSDEAKGWMVAMCEDQNTFTLKQMSGDRDAAGLSCSNMLTIREESWSTS